MEEFSAYNFGHKQIDSQTDGISGFQYILKDKYLNYWKSYKKIDY